LIVVHFDLREAVEAARRRGLKVAVLCALGKCAEADAVIHMGDGMYEVARNLYKALRDLDKLGVDVGFVAALEERGLGLAIMNRLRKAAGHREAYNLEGLLRYL